MSVLNYADWSNFIPCNDEHTVPLYVRPTFKDLVTFDLGTVLPRLTSSPSDYRNIAGSVYYNSVDQQLYYRDNASWKALGVSGAGVTFPLNATSGSNTTQIITSLVSPNVDITWAQLADGTSRMYDGTGVFESQLGYDPVLNRWFMENTIGSRNGTLALATILASTSVSTPALTTTGTSISLGGKGINNVGTIFANIADVLNTITTTIQNTATFNLAVQSNLDMNITATGILNITATTINFTGTTVVGALTAESLTTTNAITAGTKVTTSTIDAPGAGISFSSKNLTTIGAITTAGTVTVGGSLSAAGTLAVTGATTLTGALGAGNITASGTLGVTGVTTLTGALNGGNATLSGTLAVTGTTTLTGNTTAGSIVASTVVRGPLQQVFGFNPTGFKPSGLLYKMTSVFGSTNSGGTQTVATFTIPAGSLPVYGDGIKFYAAGRVSATANAKSLRLTVASTSIDSNALTISSTNVIIMEAVITRAALSTTANIIVRFIDGTSINKTATSESITVSDWDLNSNTITLSSLTGLSTNDIIIRQCQAEMFNL
jgi:hypothetical protein